MKPSSLRALIPACIVLALLAPTLFYPYGRDQGVFAYVGAALARGELPYRDVWDLKPPGIYLLYATLARIAPDPGASLMLLLRGADLAVAALTGVLLSRLARRLLQEPEHPSRAEAIGWGAAAWYAVLYLQGTFWSLAQAESWANPLVLGAALLCLTASLGSGRRVLAAGLLAGAAAVLKFTTVLPLLPFLGFALWGREQGTGRRAVKGGLFLAGTLLPLLAVGAWMFSTGIWDDYVDVQRGFVVPYSRINAAGPWSRVTNLFGYGLPWLGLVWLPALLAVFGVQSNLTPRPHPEGARRHGEGEPVSMTGSFIGCPLLASGSYRGNPEQLKWSREGRRLVLAMLGMGLLAVWVQDKYFGYHWQTVLPALSLLAAAGTACLVERLRPVRLAPAGAGEGTEVREASEARAPLWRLGAVACVGVAFGWSMLHHGAEYRDAARLAAGRISRERWLARFGPPGKGDYSFLAARWAAEYVRAHTRPGDPVLVWGFEPAVYLLAERRAPTRFFFNVPVAAPFVPERWRAEFLSDVKEHPPVLVLVLREDRIPHASGRRDDSTAQLHEWEELHGWLRTHYRPETEIEHFTIWRREDAGAAGS